MNNLHSTDFTHLKTSLLRQLFLTTDRLYQNFHHLRSIDNMVLIKPVNYHGPTIQFKNGGDLRHGNRIVQLHFDNKYLAELYDAYPEKSSQFFALHFKAAIIRSLRSLATLIISDRDLHDIAAVTGITWFRPHGTKLGFEAYPLARGIRNRLLTLHFRWLLSALCPRLARRESHRLMPHQFWLTRSQLSIFNKQAEHGAPT